MGFMVVCDAVEGVPCAEVFDAQGRRRLRQSTLGATVMSLALSQPDGALVDVIDGYRDGEELFAADGARSAVLAPFSNRIAYGRYDWQGASHQLPAGDGAHALHGVAMTLSWRLVQHHADHHSATLTHCAHITPQTLTGYPFDIELTLVTTLTEQALDWSLSARNTGENEAPVGLGWHPYLLPPGGEVDACTVQFDPARRVRTDATLIPLAGAAARAFEPEDQLRLAGQALDTCFVREDTATPCTTRVSAPNAQYALSLSQSSGVMHLFTGDPLETRPRASVAVEPNEFMPDAFNRPECRQGLVLVPASERTFSVTLRLEPVS